jgi:hypothetical protein
MVVAEVVAEVVAGFVAEVITDSVTVDSIHVTSPREVETRWRY